nr:MAG TPA: hypothetical protein [Crassvirales sp.]
MLIYVTDMLHSPYEFPLKVSRLEVDHWNLV